MFLNPLQERKKNMINNLDTINQKNALSLKHLCDSSALHLKNKDFILKLKSLIKEPTFLFS